MAEAFTGSITADTKLTFERQVPNSSDPTRGKMNRRLKGRAVAGQRDAKSLPLPTPSASSLPHFTCGHAGVVILTIRPYNFCHTARHPLSLLTCKGSALSKARLHVLTCVDQVTEDAILQRSIVLLTLAPCDALLTL